MIPTAKDVVGALERRYNPKSPQRQYATFTELCDESNRRRIDFLAVNVWLSRGRIVEGVEVKVRRADWLKELREPKADSWFRVASRWWIAAPQGVVRASEVPAGWGFLEVLRGPRSWKLEEKVAAPALSPAEDWPQWFVLRLLARSDEKRQTTPEEIAQASAEGYDRGLQDERRRQEARRSPPPSHLRDPEAELRAILKALGMSRYDPNDKRLGDLRLALMLIREGRAQYAAENLIRRYTDVIELVREAMGEAPAAEPAI